MLKPSLRHNIVVDVGGHDGGYSQADGQAREHGHDRAPPGRNHVGERADVHGESAATSSV